MEPYPRRLLADKTRAVRSHGGSRAVSNSRVRLSRQGRHEGTATLRGSRAPTSLLSAPPCKGGFRAVLAFLTFSCPRRRHLPTQPVPTSRTRTLPLGLKPRPAGGCPQYLGRTHRPRRARPPPQGLRVHGPYGLPAVRPYRREADPQEP